MNDLRSKRTPAAPLLPVLLGLILLLAGTAATTTTATNPYAPDTPEPGSVEAIARFTTEPRFVNPWVAYVPDSKTVPSPTKYLGHVAGAAGELSGTTKVFGYFRELDKASDRVRVEVIGRTEEGRDILLVAISDEEGIRQLDRLKAATAALADPRRTSPEQAEQIIATARPIYYFNAGLHSMETGSPEMVMEMAYRLAVSEQPMIRLIRSNVVVLINPVSEPDGRDKYVDWFYRYLKGKTDYDNLPELNPPYWGHYVYHDNNRDTHQKSLELTRAVHRMFYDYHPTVVHDLHESIPLLHTWNGTGPFNAHLDPIATNEWMEMSFHEITAMTSLGMPGVWTWGFGESWGLHYLDSVASNHNSLGRGYETFGNHSAETMQRTLRPDEETYVGKAVTAKDWYRAWPPDKTFVWSLRDNTNYMQTGCLSILQWSALHSREMLRNFYRKGYNSWQAGVKGNPFAFIIPQDQGDRLRVAQMVNLLRGHHIEVARAAAPIKVKEGEFSKGSFVVRLDQPYRNYAVDLLEMQKFPSDSPYEPYDDVSWALPAHYGIEAKRIDDETIARVPLDPIQEDVVPAGHVTGSGPVYLLKDTGQEALLAARFRLSKFKIEIAEKAFESDGATYPAGSWILPAQDGLRGALDGVATELSLDFAGAGGAPGVAHHDAPIPRLAVWHTWADTESVGWVRYALDHEKIPYAYIRDEEIRAGGLRDKYDIVLYGNVYLSLKDQINGIEPRYGPMPYTKTAAFPSHGVPDASDDITGGIGWSGMANLQKFLDAGGLLITLANGSALPLEGGLVRRVSRSNADLFTPGVELRVKFTRPDHPIAYGYPEVTSVFRQGYPIYELRPADRRWMVLQWGLKLPKDERDDDAENDADDAKADKNKEEKAGKDDDDAPLVVSGGARHLENLEGRPAIMDLPAGVGARGHVLAFNFNPMHRDLNHSDYRFLWNGILNWSALPKAEP
ncbi:MAG TPA: M14 family zinc carboxypeptidase [Patescibacteria group bacterium]|nr:M14 family zinc carboxypeptidase [Patescibacteria group bacterium]